MKSIALPLLLLCTLFMRCLALDNAVQRHATEHTVSYTLPGAFKVTHNNRTGAYHVDRLGKPTLLYWCPITAPSLFYLLSQNYKKNNQPREETKIS